MRQRFIFICAIDHAAHLAVAREYLSMPVGKQQVGACIFRVNLQRFIYGVANTPIEAF